MAEASAPIPLTTISDILGGFLVETFIVAILCGVAITKGYEYWRHSSQDSLWFRTGIVLVLAAELSNTAFTIQLVYFYCISGFGRPENLGMISCHHVDRSVGVIVLTGSLVTLYTHLCRNNLLSGFLCDGFSSVSFSPSLFYPFSSIYTMLCTFLLWYCACRLFSPPTCDRYKSSDWMDYRHTSRNSILVTTDVSTTAAIDTVISVGLVLNLRSRRTGIEDFDDLLHKLVVYAINNGILATCNSFLIVITFRLTAFKQFLLFKDSLAFAGLIIVSHKLYAISLLGTLTSRRIIRKHLSDRNSIEFTERFTTQMMVCTEVQAQEGLDSKYAYPPGNYPAVHVV
ncbi:hypothetical protein C8Q75DRAFT_728972 [Abortiporus biennis]|nr:hypothetical protein C8Q75DRAFT_728972 [Abortiporus biennis]